MNRITIKKIVDKRTSTTLQRKITYKHTDIELLQRGYDLNDIHCIRRNMGL
jgi:hypothetical protein